MPLRIHPGLPCYRMPYLPADITHIRTFFSCAHEVCRNRSKFSAYNPTQEYVHWLLLRILQTEDFAPLIEQICWDPQKITTPSRPAICYCFTPQLRRSNIEMDWVAAKSRIWRLSTRDELVEVSEVHPEDRWVFPLISIKCSQRPSQNSLAWTLRADQSHTPVIVNCIFAFFNYPSPS